MIFVLLITGCNNQENGKKIISDKLNSYDVTIWEKSDSDQDKIVQEIMKVWEKNNEIYNVNFEINKNSVKVNINEYINTKSPKKETSIFKIACEVVGINYNLYDMQ